MIIIATPSTAEEGVPVVRAARECPRSLSDFAIQQAGIPSICKIVGRWECYARISACE